MVNMDGSSDKAHRILYCFAEIAEYYNNTTPNDMGLSVIEGRDYLAYVAAQNLDLKIKKGDKLKEGILADIAMKQREQLVKVYSKETSPFGVPYVANAFPILDNNGDAIGCVVTTQSTVTQDLIKQTSDEMSASSSELEQKMGSLEESSQILNNLGMELYKIASQTVEQAKNIDEILNIIKSISSQTNLLGLNAAIEAARLGNAGKAFEVVANEIRKLAKRSAESVKEVTDVLNEIREHNIQAHGKSSDIFKYVKTQVDTINHTTMSSQELSKMAKKLQQIANEMWDE